MACNGAYGSLNIALDSCSAAPPGSAEAFIQQCRAGPETCLGLAVRHDDLAPFAALVPAQGHQAALQDVEAAVDGRALLQLAALMPRLAGAL